MALTPTIEVRVDADTAAAVAQVAASAKAMEASLENIDAKINFPNQDKEAEKSGTDTNKAWWKGYQKEDEKGGNKATSRLKKRLALWGGLIAGLGETVGVALYGAGGAIASLAASLSSAIGSSALLVPVLAGVGAAVGVLAIGTSGVADGFKAINEEWAASVKEGRAFNIEAEGIVEALGALSPAAAAFVTAFAGIRGELAGIKTLVQENLFAGLGESLTAFATQQLPGIGAAFAGIATVLNEAFKDVLATISTFDLGGLLDNLIPVIDNVVSALAPLVGAFLSFLQTATPYANELSGLFKQWAIDLGLFVQSAEGTEAIEGFLTRSLESLRSWTALVGAVGRAFSTFIRIASSEGDGLIDSLTRIIGEFNAWMNTVEGETAVKNFLETASRILKAMTPILDGLVGLFDKLVTPGAVARFEDLAKVLGDILPFIGSLLEIVGRTQILNTFIKLIGAVVEALDPLIEPVQKLADVIAESLVAVLDSLVESGVLDALVEGLILIAEAAAELLTAIFSNQEFLDAFFEGLSAIVDVVLALLPVVLQLVPVLLSMLPAITGILGLLPPLAELILALMPAIQAAVDLMLLWQGIQTALFGFIADVAIVVLETLIGWLTSLVDLITGAVIGAIEGLSSAWQATTADIAEFWNRNVGPIVTAIGNFGRLIGETFVNAKDAVLRAWNEMIQGVKDQWNRNIQPFLDRIGSIFQGIWDGVTRGISNFIDAVGNLWTDFKSAMSDTWEDIKGVWDKAVAFFKELPGRIGDALSSIVDKISEPFRKAWEKAKEYVDKIKNLPSNIAGGIGGFVGSLNPFARGGLVFGPTPALIGEAGAEAVIPLHRPLSQIDPSVRAMAALLRGQDTGSRTPDRVNVNGGGGRVINANFTINDATGNAETTATKVVNRLARL